MATYGNPSPYPYYNPGQTKLSDFGVPGLGTPAQQVDPSMYMGPVDPSYLPFQQELQRNVWSLSPFIDAARAEQPKPEDLARIAQSAREEAGLRGLQGGLAVSMSTDATSRYRNMWESARQQRMLELMGAQNQSAGVLREQEAQNRMRKAQALAAEKARRRARAQALWTAGGTVLGAVAGTVATPFTGGLINPVTGAGVGGAVGAGLGAL